MTMDNPARDTFVASLTDPAFDRAHASWRDLSRRYAETRAVADLAALPCRDGLVPTLWRIRALSVSARAGCYTSSIASLQRLQAVRFGLVARLDNARFIAGKVEATSERIFEPIKGISVAQVSDDDIQAQVESFGGVWVDEIGDIILHRADLPPSRFVRFPLPLSSALVDG